MILQHLLPYFIDALQDDSPLVKVEAGVSGLELLERVKNPIALQPTDFKLFQVYIFPEYRKLSRQGSDYIQTTFMSLLGKLATFGKRCIEQQIMNENKYLQEVSVIENTPRLRRKASQDAFIEVPTLMTNLQIEADEIAKELFLFSLDALVKMDPVYLSPFASNLAE